MENLLTTTLTRYYTITTCQPVKAVQKRSTSSSTLYSVVQTHLLTKLLDGASSLDEVLEEAVLSLQVP